MSAQTVTINGKVKEVTASALTVVDDQKAELGNGLDAKTKITKAGKNATIADITPSISAMNSCVSGNVSRISPIPNFEQPTCATLVKIMETVARNVLRDRRDKCLRELPH